MARMAPAPPRGELGLKNRLGYFQSYLIALKPARLCLLMALLPVALLFIMDQVSELLFVAAELKATSFRGLVWEALGFIFPLWLFGVGLFALTLWTMSYHPNYTFESHPRRSWKIGFAYLLAVAMPVAIMIFIFCNQDSRAETWSRLTIFLTGKSQEAFTGSVKSNAALILSFLTILAVWVSCNISKHIMESHIGSNKSRALIIGENRKWIWLLGAVFLLLIWVSLWFEWFVGFPISNFLGLEDSWNVLFYGLTAIAAVLAVITVISDHLRIGALTTLLILVLIVGSIFTGSRHTLIDLRPVAEETSISAINTYASKWFNQNDRKARIDQAIANNSAAYKPYIITAEGGGIRAAMFTGEFLHRLVEEDESMKQDIFALNGVSGGAVGIASFLADETVALGDTAPAEKNNASRIKTFLAKDHLAPMFAGLLFFDAPTSILPIPGLNSAVPDRARWAHKSYKRKWNELYDNDALSQGFLKITNTDIENLSGFSPVIAFQTSRTNDGAMGVISNVNFTERDDCRGLGHNLLTCKLAGAKKERANDIPLIDAAMISARFPLVSPTARMVVSPPDKPDEKLALHYVDGGYYDNSGAVSALLELTALRNAITDYCTIYATNAQNAAQADATDTQPASDAAEDALDPQSRLGPSVSTESAQSVFDNAKAYCRSKIQPQVIVIAAAPTRDAADTSIETAKAPAIEYLAPVNALYRARQEKGWDSVRALCVALNRGTQLESCSELSDRMLAQSRTPQLFVDELEKSSKIENMLFAKLILSSDQKASSADNANEMSAANQDLPEKCWTYQGAQTPLGWALSDRSANLIACQAQEKAKELSKLMVKKPETSASSGQTTP